MSDPVSPRQRVAKRAVLIGVIAALGLAQPSCAQKADSEPLDTGAWELRTTRDGCWATLTNEDGATLEMSWKQGRSWLAVMVRDAKFKSIVDGQTYQVEQRFRPAGETEDIRTSLEVDGAIKDGEPGFVLVSNAEPYLGAIAMADRLAYYRNDRLLAAFDLKRNPNLAPAFDMCQQIYEP